MYSADPKLVMYKKDTSISLKHFIKAGKESGQLQNISIGLAEIIYDSFNAGQLNSENLEFLRRSLNSWHEGNEELLRMFTQK